jgi:Domain of unknown function (DUF1992)
MLSLELIAEAKIAEAARAGAFDNLPGSGRPLDLDDDRMVPEEARLAYRILRNAGFVPAEIETRREAASLRQLLATATDDAEKSRAAARLTVIEMALEAARGRGLPRAGSYRALLLKHLGR